MEIGTILSIVSIFFLSSFDISCGQSGSSSRSLNLNTDNLPEMYHFIFPENADNPWSTLRDRRRKHSEKNDQLWMHLCFYLWPRREMFRDYERTCSYLIHLNTMGVTSIIGNYTLRSRTDFVRCTCMRFDPVTGNSIHDKKDDEFYVTSHSSATYFILTNVGVRDLKLQSITYNVPVMYEDVAFSTDKYRLADLR